MKELLDPANPLTPSLWVHYVRTALPELIARVEELEANLALAKEALEGVLDNDEMSRKSAAHMNAMSNAGKALAKLKEAKP